MGLRLPLAPLRLLRLPVDEIALTLLLSLRFMALVTEEMRNLSLGLAARAVPWRRLPPGGGVQARSLLSQGRESCRYLGNASARHKRKGCLMQEKIDPLALSCLICSPSFWLAQSLHMHIATCD